MPEQFLQLPSKERLEILQTAAAELGIQAIVLEKDVWVCWALQTLFSMPDHHPMAFKGGTSLSKIYNAINRFSEDVDITLDYKSFGENFDPFDGNSSKTAIRKYSKRLQGYVKDYAHGKVIPHIQNELHNCFDPQKFKITSSEDGEKIRVAYESALDTSSDYLQTSILIELGGRNVIDPHELHVVTPDIAKLVPTLGFPSSEVTVLSPERTFWEKVTLIHVECNRPEIKENAARLSRHWYDLYMLLQHPTGATAINNRELLEDVVQHKRVFFHTSYANFDACLNGELQLVPKENTIAQLRQDYEEMDKAGMFYTSPPTFEEMVKKLEEAEQQINSYQPAL